VRRLLSGRLALVVAFAAGLAIAGAATAGAKGLLVSGKQIKNGTVAAQDLTPGLRRLIRAPGPRGPQGRQGPQGAQGPQGPQGQAGFASTTLPAGQTLRGVFNMDATGAAAGASQGEGISFALSLRAAPALVIRPTDAPPTQECPGSVANPQAAAGVLCVYINGASNLETTPNFPAGVRVLDFPDQDPGASVFGAEMYVFSQAAGRFFADGTWAVTGN
jgi:hypothetical protein